MASKIENDGFNAKVSKKQVVLKNALKMGFGCQSNSFFNQGIEWNQGDMWQVEVEPCGDGCQKNMQ